MMQRRIFLPVVILVLLISPFTALANDGLPITVTPVGGECGATTFEVSFMGADSTYDLSWVMGDGQSLEQSGVTLPYTLEYTYTAPGEFTWSVEVTDSNNPALSGVNTGTVKIGPLVTLISDPMPPFLELNGGQASAIFTAQVDGGKAPFNYSWNMGGAFSLHLGPEQNSVTASYAAAGEFTARVTVTDACGYSSTSSLTVVVIDTVIPSCHPTAQKIADAVNTLFPVGQAEQLYTCEDIYNIFLGDLTGSHTGFGRLWHAYKLAATIEELTWEQIRDWQLDGSGWGILVQLDKFADALDEVSILDLMEKVASGENTVNQIRTAIRNVIRYGADFEDALTRLAEGASPGSLGQFYRVAEELGILPEELDGYLEQGIDFSEIRHASKLASQLGVEWADIALAHNEGYSWGEIKQALRMADEDTDVMALLDSGGKEARKQQREESRSEQVVERDIQTAAKIAEQYGSTEGEVMAMYKGDCAFDWNCVRKHFREAAENGKSDQDQSTAKKLAAQYGVSEGEVWDLFEGDCAGDWKCVRTQLHDQSRGEPGKGKGKD